MFDPGKPFLLPKIPPPITFSNCPHLEQNLVLFNDAQKNVSELKGALDQISNPGLFLNPFYLQESVQSSAVENIHTTIESALKDETKSVKEQKPENKEVIKYREALIAGHQSQQQYGLTSRTIRTIHRSLNVEKGTAGAYRRIQNNIANKRPGRNPKVIYTPPPHTDIENLMSNWEKYVHENKDMLPLIRIAICHYQFEAIHPFEDGNGRTGRILMVLQFLKEGLLNQPLLFVSGYLSEHEARYKKLLLEVTANGNWWGFILFMIRGFAIQAAKTKITLLKLYALRRELRAFLYSDSNHNIRKTNIDLVADHLFQNPFTNPKFMAKATSIHWQTCSKYLNYLAGQNLLKKDKIGRYVFYSNLGVLNALREE